MENIEVGLQQARIADIHDIVSRYNDWAISSFPKSTPTSSLLGLRREVDETIEAIQLLDKHQKEVDGMFDTLFDSVRLEYADCLMYLIDSARRCGLSIDDLFFALDEKLQIKLQRDWKINDDNSYSHVK